MELDDDDAWPRPSGEGRFFLPLPTRECESNNSWPIKPSLPLDTHFDINLKSIENGQYIHEERVVWLKMHQLCQQVEEMLQHVSTR